jgi:phasin
VHNFLCYTIDTGKNREPHNAGRETSRSIIMAVKKTEDAFSMASFDPSKFTDTVREFAEKNSAKTKEALSKVKEATEEAGKTVEATFHNAQAGSAEFGKKAIEMLRTNTENSYAHLESMFNVKSVAELFELQTAFFRKQAELAVEQARALQETSKKVAESVAKPVKDATEKAMSSFKIGA